MKTINTKLKFERFNQFININCNIVYINISKIIFDIKV